MDKLSISQFFTLLKSKSQTLLSLTSEITSITNLTKDLKISLSEKQR